MSEALLPVLGLLVKSTLIVGATWIVAAAMRAARLPASQRYQAWACAVVLLALLPILEAVMPGVTVKLPLSAIGLAGPDLSRPGVHLPDRAMRSWVGYLLAAGAALLVLRFVFACLALRRLWQRARPVDDPQLELCARSAGIAPGVEVRVSRTPVPPLAWGRRVLLPPDFPDWPPARRRDVLVHEFVHIARHDSRVLTLALLVRAAYWFSPAAWFALRELRVAQEHACDERVLSHGIAPVDYAHSLVDVAASQLPAFAASASAMARRSSLEHRVEAILTGGTGRPARRGIALGAIAALLAAGALIAAVQPVDPTRALSPLAPLSPLATRLVPLATPLAPGRASDAYVPATPPGLDPAGDPPHSGTATR